MKDIQPSKVSHLRSLLKKSVKSASESSAQESDYKSLQTEARKYKLPGNIKGSILRDLIGAAKKGNRQFVDEFLRERETERKLKKEKRDAAKMAHPPPLDSRKQQHKVKKKKKKLPRPTLSTPSSSPLLCSARGRHSVDCSSTSSTCSNFSFSDGLSKQVKFSLPPVENLTSPFLPSLQPLSSPYGEYQNSRPSFEFPFNPRERQSYVPPASQVFSAPLRYPPLPGFENFQASHYAQQPFNYGAQSLPESNMHSHQPYSSHSTTYLPPTYNRYASAFSNYRTSVLPDDFSPIKMPPLSSLPNFGEFQAPLPKPPSLDDSSQSLASFDMDLLNDDVTSSQSTSMGSGQSVTSSMENNLSWTSHCQEMFKLFNETSSFNAMDSQVSNKRLDCIDADLLSLLPELQYNDSQMYSLTHDSFTPSQQVSSAGSMDYRVQNPYSQCTTSTTPSMLTATSSSSFYTNMNTPSLSYQGPNFAPFCDLCPPTPSYPCRYCRPEEFPPISFPPLNSAYSAPLNSQPSKSAFSTPVNSQPSKSVFSTPVNSQPSKNAFSTPVNSQPSKSSFSTPVNSQPSKSGFSTPVNSQPSKSAFSTPVNSQPSKSAFSTPVNSQPWKSAFSVPVNSLPSQKTSVTPVNSLPSKSALFAPMNFPTPENVYAASSSQVVQDMVNVGGSADDSGDSLLDGLDDSGDITLQLLMSDECPGDESDDFDSDEMSDEVLIINEDVKSEESNGATECRMECTPVENGMDKSHPVAQNSNKIAEISMVWSLQDNEEDKTFSGLQFPSLTNNKTPNVNMVDSIVEENTVLSELAEGSVEWPYKEDQDEKEKTFYELQPRAIGMNEIPDVDNHVPEFIIKESQTLELAENRPSTPLKKTNANSQTYSCPVSGCQDSWDCRTQSIDEHVRQSHKEEILDIFQYKNMPHKFSTFAILSEGSNCSIMESQNSLFILSIFHYQGRFVVVLQYLPKTLSTSDKAASSLQATLEVTNAHKAPDTWTGKIHSYFTPVAELFRLNQCLILNQNELGSTISVWFGVRAPQDDHPASAIVPDNRRILRSDKKRKRNNENTCNTCTPAKVTRKL